MFKRKVLLAILFILGISLLNVAVLIEASNQENPLFVDPSEQQPMPVDTYHTGRECNTSSNLCDIDNADKNCWQYSSSCS